MAGLPSQRKLIAVRNREHRNCDDELTQDGKILATAPGKFMVVPEPPAQRSQP